MIRTKNIFVTSAVGFALLVFGQAALATADSAVVNQVFAGHYRAPVKTSIAKTSAGVKKHPSVISLLQSLPNDSAMRSKYPALRKGVKNWPPQREPEELINVRVNSCWICAVKYEHGAKGDNDFHLILSNSPTPPFTTVMNVEVAALPKTGPDVSRLKGVRATFLSFFLAIPPTSNFAKVSPPIHVRIEGSLYFDGDHNAGGQKDPGPSWAKPKTVWELHPIYKLTRLN